MNGGFLKGSYNDFFPVPGRSISAPVTGGDWSTGPRSLFDPVPPASVRSGPYTEDLPSQPTGSRGMAGGNILTFVDDFYNQIHFFPKVIDFGWVYQDVTRQAYVWNAFYRQSATLLSAEYDPEFGIAIDGAIPRVFRPLEQVLYPITAAELGPPSLNTWVIWTFSVPKPSAPIFTFRMRILGERIQDVNETLFTYTDWKNYRITYEFKTEISVSTAGKEQRVARRNTPRKFHTREVLLRGDELRDMNRRMRLNQAREWTMMEVPRFTIMDQPFGIGEERIYMAEVPEWAVAGNRIVLEAGGQAVSFIVRGSTPEYVEVFGYSEVNWPIGTKMTYAMVGHMKASLDNERHTNEHSTLKVDFEVSPTSEAFIDPPAAPRVFNSREVMMLRPNWSNGVGASFEWESTTLDFGAGPVARFTPIKFPAETRRLTFLGRDFAGVEAVRNFFYRMRGRQGEFYMPTWELEIFPMAQTTIAGIPLYAQVGDANLRIKGREFADQFLESTVYKAFFVWMKSGEVRMNRIIGMDVVIDELGNDTLLTLQYPWEERIEVDEVYGFGWMPLWRLSSDQMTVDWLTNSVGQVQLTMQTIEDLPPENY